MLEVTEGDDKGKEIVSKIQETQQEGILNKQEKEEAQQRKKEMVALGITAMKEIRESEKGRELLATGLEYVKEIEQEGGVQALLGKGEVLLSDTEKRQELIDGIKDKALDFLLEYLPTVQISKINGKKEEYSINYELDNIDLSGLLIPKTSVDVQLNLIPGKVVGTSFLLVSRNIRVDLRKVRWAFERTCFPRINGGGGADCKSEDVEFRVSLEVEENEQGHPLLAMKNPTITIHQLELVVSGSSVSSLYNMLVGLFESAVKIKLEESLVEKLVETSQELLGPLNQLASDYWPLIQSLADSLLKKEVEENAAKIEEVDSTAKEEPSSSSSSSSSPSSSSSSSSPAPSPSLI